MIYLGADHRGFNLKEQIKDFLKSKDIAFEDSGNLNYEPGDDYPDFALGVAKKVSENLKENKGILLCGTGIGVDIAANKIKGIRAGLCLSSWMAEVAKKDDDINILCLASDLTDMGTAMHIINAWLDTKFSNGEKYIRRIDKISKIENSHG